MDSHKTGSTVSFQGIITAIHYGGLSGRNYIIICAAARRGRETAPIMLELHFSEIMRSAVDSRADNLRGPAVNGDKLILHGDVANMECGMLARGHGQLNHLEDGFFILHNPEIEQLLSMRSPRGFDGLPWSSRKFPGLARIILRRARILMHRWLDLSLPWQFLPDYTPCHAFSGLLASAFATGQITLAYMSGPAILIKNLSRICSAFTRGRHKCLCLAPRPECQSAATPFILCGSIATGRHYHEAAGTLLRLDNMEITGVKSRSLGHIIFFGSATARKLAHPDCGLLASFHDNLLDFNCILPFFWKLSLPRCSPPRAMPRIMEKLESQLNDYSCSKPGKIHGWWYEHGYWATNLNETGTGIPGIKLIHYNEPGWPNRLFVIPADCPEDAFPDYGCSVEISGSPRILEGSFRPNDKTWRMLCGWIEKHRNTLIDKSVSSPDLWRLKI